MPPGLLATPIRQIAAGYLHTCALTQAGAFECRGDKSYGQSDPSAIGPVTAIAAGYVHTCAFKAVGAVACWGTGPGWAFGQSDVPSGLKATAISAGAYHTCALKADGSTVCWGAIDSDGTTANYGQATPPVPSGEVTFKDGAAVLGSAMLMDGVATFDTSAPLRVGRHALAANFAGEMPVYAASSSTVSHLVTGTGGADRLVGTGGADVLHGIGGNDVILGRGGNDVIDGGAGRDRIVGGSGRDTMTGGPGADTFVFNRAADSPARRPDVITDFNVRQGDKIDLSKFDINTRQRGLQRVSEYRGTRKFTRKAGEIRFNRARKRLEIDTNGNGRANFRVILQGVTNLPKRALKLR